MTRVHHENDVYYGIVETPAGETYRLGPYPYQVIAWHHAKRETERLRYFHDYGCAIKPVVGFPGYFVAEDGQVFGLRYLRPLVQCLDKYGYATVRVCRNNTASTRTVHRIVAEAFIPNPDHKPQVNHLSGVKSDNRVSNLEWATTSENHSHAFGTGLRPPCGGVPKRPVEQWRDGRLVQTFASTIEAQRAGFKASSVRAVANGKATHHRGFQWRFATQA